jgi:hypothetical protein
MTTAYATYTYYTTTYLGTAIASADFNALALRASAVIDQITFGRAALETAVATVDSIKMACCAVADELQAQIGSSGGGIQSESIGANSVSYKEGAYATLTDKEKQTRAAAVYLGSTGLMFKGFASGEYGGTPADDED